MSPRSRIRTGPPSALAGWQPSASTVLTPGDTATECHRRASAGQAAGARRWRVHHFRSHQDRDITGRHGTPGNGQVPMMPGTCESSGGIHYFASHGCVAPRLLGATQLPRRALPGSQLRAFARSGKPVGALGHARTRRIYVIPIGVADSIFGHACTSRPGHARDLPAETGRDRPRPAETGRDRPRSGDTLATCNDPSRIRWHRAAARNPWCWPWPRWPARLVIQGTRAPAPSPRQMLGPRTHHHGTTPSGCS